MGTIVENAFGTVCVFVKKEGELKYWLEIPTQYLDGSFTYLSLVRYSKWNGNTVVSSEPNDAEEVDICSFEGMSPRFFVLLNRFNRMNVALKKRVYFRDDKWLTLTKPQQEKLITKIYPMLLTLILKELGIAGLTHKLYESPSRERNEDKYGTLCGNQCICCMKPMKKGETKWVHMNTNWLAVDVSISEENCRELTGADSQGCFNIGDSCAKKMPKNFILNNIHGNNK